MSCSLDDDAACDREEESSKEFTDVWKGTSSTANVYISIR